MMLRVTSTGIDIFQYFTIKIKVNEGQSCSVIVTPIIFSMFDAKLSKNLISKGILATFVTNISH